MLRKQLYIVSILSILLPILLIGSFLVRNNYSLLYSHHQDMLQSENLRVRSIIFEITTSITNVCDTLREDEGLYELLGTKYMTQEEARLALETYSSIRDIYERHTDISSIKIYTKNPTLYSYGHIEVVDEENEAWFERLTEKQGYYWDTLVSENQFGIKSHELILYHMVKLPKTGEVNLIVISVSNNYLKNRIDNNKLDVDLTLGGDPVFFSTLKQTGQVIDFNGYETIPFYQYRGQTQYFGHSALLEVSTFKPIKSQDSIHIFSSDLEAIQAIKRILNVTMLIVFFSVAIPIVIIVKYTRQLTNRVDTLRTEMHRVTGGDYNIIETFKGNDELAELFADLKIMIASIKDRDQTIFDNRIKEQQLINHQQKMELEILASKINPHFLYNTLETIRMKAFSNDDLEVANGVKLLGRYMRYNLESTGEATTLKSELDFIEIYLKIQKLRFTSKIDYQMVIDESLDTDHILILPLLIQPIVENALLHGHEETIEGGLIEIRVMSAQQDVLIDVWDNGCGMNEEALTKLRRKIRGEEKPLKSSFGLYNIHQRLKLYYGESYGLHVTSTIEKGTTIGFMIPMKNDKEVGSC